MFNKKVYFLSDQFGARFISLRDVQIDPEWISFNQSANISDLIYNRSSGGQFFGITRRQFRKSHFERLLKSYTFNGYFKGCIEIPFEVIECICEGELPNINKYDYLQIVDNEVLCRNITRDDFRAFQLDKII